uniref:Serine protease 16 n=1 Tax=Paramormyrops kingsleyae TaxID=1676925 RepID=A0A3B3S6E7_9TELE
MRSTLLWCACLVLLFGCAYSGQVLRKIKENVFRAQNQKAKQHLLQHSATGHQPTYRVKEGLIRQPLDQFDSQSTQTIPQRFFVNEEYWDRPDGPVFLYIGGEGAISELSVLYGHHVQMAEENGALLVALEHRFYGRSINPDGLDVVNLRHLSSRQALVDLAAFHRYISERYDLSSQNTWISFGGSYAGALSAWLRGKFPHLIYGAVASSAPVKAMLDFSTYNQVVGESLTNEAVGGSDKCLGTVWEAFAALETALLEGNVTKVGKDFSCCEPPVEPEDQAELVQSLADIFMGTVQYNKEGGPLTIGQICDVLTNKSEETQQGEGPYSRLVNLAMIYRAAVEEPCLIISHKQAVLELQNTDLKSSGFGYRQWYYQSCTEFGFFETCEDASCPFARMVTLQSQMELCPLVFGIAQGSLQSRIAFTNQFYGGDHPQTQRVLYVNGDIDPWHKLSVVRNGTKEDKDRAILIEGTAHCADMNRAGSQDSPALRKARQEIKRHVTQWLKSAAAQSV